MRGEVIKSYLIRRPFVPFRLHLSDGSFCDVTSPVKAIVNDDITLLNLFRKPFGEPYWDEPDIIDNAHVVKLVPIVD